LHTVACALTAKRPLVIVLLELFAGVAPLVWCIVTSRPPADAARALPADIAHGGICRNVPRFISFAIATAMIETYSTVNAAWAVAATSCETSPWQTLGLHCFGVVVAVGRVYSALLGLRLQDDFAAANRRVLPDPNPPPLAAGDIDCDLGRDLEANAKKSSLAARFDRLSAAAFPGSTKFSELMDGPPPPELSEADRLPDAIAECMGQAEKKVARVPGKQDSGQTWERPSRPRRCCKALGQCCGAMRKGMTRRMLLKAVLVCVLVIAPASVFVTRALKIGEPTTKPFPSSCLTRQNATSTCRDFESIGDHIWDASKGDTLAGGADTEEDCCHKCDKLDGCQAWLFEARARRCRLIRFRESPCSDNPGDIRCRCLAHAKTSFGFRPISHVVWLHRDM